MECVKILIYLTISSLPKLTSLYCILCVCLSLCIGKLHNTNIVRMLAILLQEFGCFVVQFSAENTVCFGPQTATTSSTVTSILPMASSSSSSTVKDIQQQPPQGKREMKIDFRQKVTKACSQHLKFYVKENRITKVGAIIKNVSNILGHL